MKKFIKTFKNEFEKDFNEKLINREYEPPLIDFVVNIFKSLESTGMIKLIDWEYNEDESKIDLSKYITSRKKVKKKMAHIKYFHIQHDRCGELVMKFELNVKGKKSIIRKAILIPKMDNNNYMTLRGKKYFLLYQLVDNSTYTSRNALTLKSLMPLCVKRGIENIVDVLGNEYKVQYYYLAIFKRDIEGLLFYLCKFGLTKTLKYFNVGSIMVLLNSEEFTNEDKSDETFLYFKLNGNFYLKVSKYFFDKFSYVQSMVCMVKRIMIPKANEYTVENPMFWTGILGGLYTKTTYKKESNGMSTIVFFERLLDETTKAVLKISESNKEDVYSVLKWIIQNYTELKKKNNLDLENKRLRLNEMVAAILSKRIGDNISRILSYGSTIELKQVKDIFKFPGTIIFQSLHKSPLLKFDDRVNDLDVFSALKYSQRGPQSLGDKSSRNISLKYRGTHPSYIGKFDLNVCSSSSPGLSGCCTMFAKTYGLYFSDKNEPETQEYELEKAYEEYMESKGKDVVRFTNCTPSEFYKSKQLSKERLERATVAFGEKDKDKIIVRIEDEEEVEDL